MTKPWHLPMMCSTSSYPDWEYYEKYEDEEDENKPITFYVCEYCACIHDTETVLEKGCCPDCGGPLNKEKLKL